jgi:uncharacterized membrane protein YdjX (TVP38/TMEM64 family)
MWPKFAPRLHRLAGVCLLLGLGLCLAICGDGWPGLDGLDGLDRPHLALLRAAESSPWRFGLVFFLLFAGLSALSVPGCSVLAMAAGPCFGLVGGTLLVALASTVGATLPFLAARHWARERVRRRWGARLTGLEAAVARDGAWLLFMLRLAPVIPFPVLNPLMGLSAMPAGRYFWVSLLGMLAGSAAYVQAGIGLQRAAAGGDWASPALLAPLLALLLLPMLGRRLKAVRAHGPSSPRGGSGAADGNTVEAQRG